METKELNYGLLIGGCTMLAMALGWYFGNFKIWMFAGIGLGMIISAFSNSKKDNNGK